MIIVVRESEYNVFNSVCDSIKCKFPKAAIVRVTDKTNIDRFKTPPLVFSMWCLCVDVKNLSMVKDDTKNIVLVRIMREAEVQEVHNILQNCEYRIIDNRKVKDVDRISWVQRTLLCSEDMAKDIIHKFKNDDRNLVACVKCMNGMGNTLLQDIVDQFVRDQVYVRDLVNHILGINVLDKKLFVKSMYFYRNAFGWLRNNLLNHISNWLNVYEAFIMSELKYSNYEQWADTHRISAYQVKSIMDSFDKVSYAHLLNTREVIRQSHSVEDLYFSIMYGGKSC